MSRVRWIAASVVVAALTAAASLYMAYGRNTEPVRFHDPIEHFKYGSIGAEVNGYPYLVWRTLPELFPDRLPRGWATFGFTSEPGHTLPVGISVRKYGLERVGFNCATCHTSTVNGGGLLLGAPANKVDLGSYLEFLVQVSRDERFTADNILEVASRQDPKLGWMDRLVYRHVVIPKLKDKLEDVAASSRWRDLRPPMGPGRTDAGNPWRARFGMHPERDRRVGTVDFPSLWNQRIRTGSWLHWDGNNRSLTERNLSAAIAGGASEESLDHASIERVAAWSLEAPPPRYPFRIDSSLALAGLRIYTIRQCAACHDPGGPSYGGTTAISEIGTDRERFDLFTEELLRNFSAVGRGRPWQFRNYRKSDGYANLALDGIWARAPYLHNGSVPTLFDLLSPPSARPRTFFRGCDAFDSARVGFTCDAGTAIRTDLPGNGNGGHTYGTDVSVAERQALIEYLKTL